jgi:ABC-type phosphate/phosphonate transport system substrate-binding protein
VQYQWLAAQELRYRTRQPLVLHVVALAAGDEESVATATGWQAELQRQALQRADLILAETPALTNRLRHDLGLPPDLVRTVPAANAQAVAMALRTAQLRSTANPS